MNQEIHNSLELLECFQHFPIVGYEPDFFVKIIKREFE